MKFPLHTVTLLPVSLLTVTLLPVSLLTVTWLPLVQTTVTRAPLRDHSSPFHHLQKRERGGFWLNSGAMVKFLTPTQTLLTVTRQ